MARLSAPWGQAGGGRWRLGEAATGGGAKGRWDSSPVEREACTGDRRPSEAQPRAAWHLHNREVVGRIKEGIKGPGEDLEGGGRPGRRGRGAGREKEKEGGERWGPGRPGCWRRCGEQGAHPE